MSNIALNSCRHISIVIVEKSSHLHIHTWVHLLYNNKTKLFYHLVIRTYLYTYNRIDTKHNLLVHERKKKRKKMKLIVIVMNIITQS